MRMSKTYQITERCELLPFQSFRTDRIITVLSRRSAGIHIWKEASLFLHEDTFKCLKVLKYQISICLVSCPLGHGKLQGPQPLITMYQALYFP